MSPFHSSPQSLVTVSESISLPLSAQLPAYVPDFSSPVSHDDTTEPPAPQPFKDFRYAYTHRQKISTFVPVPTDSFSLVEGPPPQPSTPVSDLIFLLLSAKVKDHILIILFLIFYDRLNLYFRQFALSFSSISIHRSYEEAILVLVRKQVIDEEMDALIS